MSQNQAVVIDTPGGIAHFRVTSIIRALQLEVSTGLKMRRMPSVKYLKQHYGLSDSVRTKKQAIIELERLEAQIRQGIACYEVRDGICFYKLAETEPVNENLPADYDMVEHMKKGSSYKYDKAGRPVD